MSGTRPRGRPPYADVLTPAEWRTVHAVQHGLTNREIARRRGISVDAVKTHVANAVAKLGLPDRRALRAWFRPPAASALTRRAAAMDTNDVLGPLAQIARTVRDLKASEGWYRDRLGLKHLYTFGTLAFFDLGGTRLMLSEQPLAGESVLYLRVADIRASCAALAARGVEFAAAPHLIHRHADGTEEWLAHFNDLEGRPLGLLSRVPA
ncbi:MAG TPA: LuxR C-terminal-related transcriptional regulator [Steroidobacteraceae bacterium]|nr:LuxR C-terminal-related transcriptional regulator [Steroidobacteraceae bacterium]